MTIAVTIHCDAAPFEAALASLAELAERSPELVRRLLPPSRLPRGFRRRAFGLRRFFCPVMCMSLPKPDLHIRISEEALRVLRSLAYIQHGEDYPVATLAAHVLEEALLGRGHA